VTQCHLECMLVCAHHAVINLCHLFVPFAYSGTDLALQHDAKCVC
jgi:hypothetical protein